MPSDLMTALATFRQGVSDLQTSRALTSANDQVQQIKMSEAKDEEKTAQLRQVAEGLTLNLMRYGQPAQEAKAVATTFAGEKPPLIQSPLQAYMYGTDAEKKSALEYENRQHQFQMELAASKQKEEDPMKDFFKRQKDWMDFNKSMSPDATRAGGLQVANQTIARAQNLLGLMEGKTSIKQLDEKNRIQVFETAAAFANMVKQGVVTEHELKLIFPNNWKLVKAGGQEQVTAQLPAANQGAYLQTYLKGAMREAALASARTRESLLTTASAASQLARDPKDPTSESHFKEVVSSKLNAHTASAFSADDIIVLPSGRVTTSEQQKNEQTMQNYTQKVKEAKVMLRSDDPRTKRAAQAFFDKIGLSEDTPVNQINQVLKYRVTSGEL